MGDVIIILAIVFWSVLFFCMFTMGCVCAKQAYKTIKDRSHAWVVELVMFVFSSWVFFGICAVMVIAL